MSMDGNGPATWPDSPWLIHSEVNVNTIMTRLGTNGDCIIADLEVKDPRDNKRRL